MKKIDHYVIILSEGVYDEDYGRRHDLLDIKVGKGNVKQRLDVCRTLKPNSYTYKHWKHHRDIEKSVVHKMFEENGKRLAEEGKAGGETFRIFRDKLESTCDILDNIFDEKVPLHKEKEKLINIPRERNWNSKTNRNAYFDFINDVMEINKDLVFSNGNKGTGKWSWYYKVKLYNRVIIERIYHLASPNFSVLLPGEKTVRINNDNDYKLMIEKIKKKINRLNK